MGQQVAGVAISALNLVFSQESIRKHEPLLSIFTALALLVLCIGLAFVDGGLASALSDPDELTLPQRFMPTILSTAVIAWSSPAIYKIVGAWLWGDEPDPGQGSIIGGVIWALIIHSWIFLVCAVVAWAFVWGLLRVQD